MRRSNHFFLRRIADVIFLQYSEETHEEIKIVFLNETGAFLWEKMEISCDRKFLVATLMNEYEVQEDMAMKDVASFIEYLVENGCLELEER